MAKVLVTGAAGLFGANFTRHLLSHGHSVVAIDNLMGGYREFIDPRADFYHIDLCDSHKVSKIFHAQKPDYVYHFAAYAAEGLSPFIRSFNYQNNVIASSNVINGCINNGVKKIIFTSSMAYMEMLIFHLQKIRYQNQKTPMVLQNMPLKWILL